MTDEKNLKPEDINPFRNDDMEWVDQLAQDWSEPRSPERTFVDNYIASTALYNKGYMTTDEIRTQIEVVLQKLQAILLQHPDLVPTASPVVTPAPTSAIYTAAKSCLDKSITLDATVPSDLGCAEAVSYVLQKAGIQGIPPIGYAGTSDLYTWLQQHFTAVTDPLPGDVVISPTGTSSIGTPHGHTGIVALYGILSNDSDTGLFMEKYTLASWQQYFGVALGFPVYYFRQK